MNVEVLESGDLIIEMIKAPHSQVSINSSIFPEIASENFIEEYKSNEFTINKSQRNQIWRYEVGL